MNEGTAIANGRLANNSLFFGDSLAETLSNSVDGGAWNRGRVRSTGSTQPWLIRGGIVEGGIAAGVFAFIAAIQAGGTSNIYSHRTILLGY